MNFHKFLHINSYRQTILCRNLLGYTVLLPRQCNELHRTWYTYSWQSQTALPNTVGGKARHSSKSK